MTFSYVRLKTFSPLNVSTSRRVILVTIYRDVSYDHGIIYLCRDI